MIERDVLASAFRALGTAPTHRETQLVAEALVRGGELELLDQAVEDRDALAALVAIAKDAGASAYTALDLQVAVGEAEEAGLR